MGFSLQCIYSLHPEEQSLFGVFSGSIHKHLTSGKNTVWPEVPKQLVPLVHCRYLEMHTIQHDWFRLRSCKNHFVGVVGIAKHVVTTISAVSFIMLLLDRILTHIVNHLSNTSYHLQYLYCQGGYIFGAKPNLITCIAEIFLTVEEFLPHDSIHRSGIGSEATSDWPRPCPPWGTTELGQHCRLHVFLILL